MIKNKTILDPFEGFYCEDCRNKPIGIAFGRFSDEGYSLYCSKHKKKYLALIPDEQKDVNQSIRGLKNEK